MEDIVKNDATNANQAKRLSQLHVVIQSSLAINTPTKQAQLMNL